MPDISGNGRKLPRSLSRLLLISPADCAGQRTKTLPSSHPYTFRAMSSRAVSSALEFWRVPGEFRSSRSSGDRQRNSRIRIGTYYPPEPERAASLLGFGPGLRGTSDRSSICSSASPNPAAPSGRPVRVAARTRSSSGASRTPCSSARFHDSGVQHERHSSRSSSAWPSTPAV